MHFTTSVPIAFDGRNNRTTGPEQAHVSYLWRFQKGHRDVKWWICDKCHEHMIKPPIIEEDPL